VVDWTLPGKALAFAFLFNDEPAPGSNDIVQNINAGNSAFS
jgi:hypothetical protein